jgi:hypothetical protein
MKAECLVPKWKRHRGARKRKVENSLAHQTYEKAKRLADGDAIDEPRSERRLEGLVG